MSEKTSKVVNIETPDWTPSQVARWLQNKIDRDEVENVYVVIEEKDHQDSTGYAHTWSSSRKRQELWYMISWAWHAFQKRYFQAYDDGWQE